MTQDIRDARFYIVVQQNSGRRDEDPEPMEFDEAFSKAIDLADAGIQIKVLYTDEASQTEVTRFVNRGISTAPLSGA
jgi:hypothetical protein